MSEEYISIKQLAAELGMDRSHARRYVLKFGIEPIKRRTSDSGGQLTLTVSADEADYIRQQRRDQGFTNLGRPVQQETGYFYLIQLVPELDEGRVKLGFADDVNQRLSQHRTSAPTARLVRFWACKRSWESTILDAFAACGGRLILNEVYEFDDLNSVVDYGDRLFELLPDPGQKIAIASHSPYNTHDTQNQDES